MAVIYFFCITFLHLPECISFSLTRVRGSLLFIYCFGQKGIVAWCCSTCVFGSIKHLSLTTHVQCQTYVRICKGKKNTHWWEIAPVLPQVLRAGKAFTDHRGDGESDWRECKDHVPGYTVATLTPWLTSAIGLFYWGALECVCAGDWAQGVDLMEPKGWLRWKGWICLQCTQLTH